MEETEILRKAKAYALDTLVKNLPGEYRFHNLDHTSDVAAAAETIGQASGLKPDDLDTVLIAAWLHDTGYCNGGDGHEQKAADAAATLLKSWGANEQKITDVQRTILATRMPQAPTDLLGKVICDADMAHLASPHLEERAANLRKEFATFRKMTFETDEDWYRFNLKFLKAHEYFTEFGRNVLQPKKKENMKKLKKKLGVKDNDEEKEALKLEKLKKKIEKSSRPERGIETMFRTTSENHITLSGMADTKANIMISINSIILSIVVSVLFRKLEEFPQLLIPTLMLVCTCLVTIVFAILATRPSIASGKFTRDDIKEKKTNLLFFGNFHSMDLKDYEWGMREMMKDYEYLYGSMIKDIYFLGKVLARKYRFLRLAYTFFMFGFTVSIITFIIAMMSNHQNYKVSAFFFF